MKVFVNSQNFVVIYAVNHIGGARTGVCECVNAFIIYIHKQQKKKSKSRQISIFHVGKREKNGAGGLKSLSTGKKDWNRGCRE